MLSSYPSIFTLGHKAVAEILRYPVVVEEKIDGSQISFGLDGEGAPSVRSKGVEIPIHAPAGMFQKGVETVLRLHGAGLLVPGITYRGEYLSKPKHNTLAYGRVPRGHIILFDADNGPENWADYELKAQYARNLGLEVVPRLFEGMLDGGMEQLAELLNRESVLGGCQIEGIVIKQKTPQLFGLDKKALIAKFVSAEFQEKHRHEWKQSNPSAQDVVFLLGSEMASRARWAKATQRLRDNRELDNTPRDIGKLMKEIPEDILREEEDYIKDRLFKYAWPQIKRMATKGLPEWYKDLLLKDSLGQ